ncbi:MAG: trypsin-like peptidase domain-containing protein [Prevotella sp.]
MYYKLTYLKSPDRKQTGDKVFCSGSGIDIGQTASCEVSIGGNGDYEPTVMASILPIADGEGWIVVRRDDGCEISVNGTILETARQLEENDRITLGTSKDTTTLKFNICKDGDYNSAKGTVVYKQHRQNHKLQFISAIAALAATAIAVTSLLARKDRDMLSHYDIDKYESSVYHISIDSVYLLKDTICQGDTVTDIVEALAMDSVTSGTCFLTDNGLFVTARHCVEPWITDENWDGNGLSHDMPAALRLATKAETRNAINENNAYKVVAHCVISNPVERYEFLSSDFHTNTTRDQVIRLGTEQEPLYWRTIMPLATRRDMELGDFAYAEAGNIEGNLSLASMEDLKDFGRQDNKDIVVIGFPVNDNGNGDICTRVYGNSQHPEFNSDSTSLRGCIQMSAAINKGNSGGPVIAIVKGKVKVVGIVSKSDNHALQNTFWSVPSSEVIYLMDHGGTIKEFNTYRR